MQCLAVPYTIKNFAFKVTSKNKHLQWELNEGKAVNGRIYQPQIKDLNCYKIMSSVNLKEILPIGRQGY
jgi:hypothetical protein